MVFSEILDLQEGKQCRSKGLSADENTVASRGVWMVFSRGLGLFHKLSLTSGLR